jgi:hypothetical protein
MFRYFKNFIFILPQASGFTVPKFLKPGDLIAATKTLDVDVFLPFNGVAVVAV